MRQKKSPQEIYLDKHRKCGIKVGDKVEVMRKCETDERGWNNSWQTKMNGSVGRVGTVTRDKDTHGFSLVFEDNPELPK